VAIGLRGSGTIDDSFPLNPSYPAGGQSQDLNVLTIIASGVNTFWAADGNGGWGNGVWQTPVTPAGWTLLKSPIHEPWCTYQFFPGYITVYTYVRVGAYTGPIGEVAWTGPGSQPDRAMAGIDIFSCGASETWDYTIYAHGHDVDGVYNGGDNDISVTTSQLGSTRSGRVDPGPGDWEYILVSLNAANAPYPILDVTNTQFNPGAGSSGGGYVNLKTDWMSSTGFGNQNEGLTLVRSYYNVVSTGGSYGSPSIHFMSYNPAVASMMVLRLALRQRATSNDLRSSTDRTKIFGLTSSDTAPATESTENNGPKTLNPMFETDILNWTAGGGATLTGSVLQFHAGGASLQITPNGAGNNPSAQSDEVSIVPNGYYRAHAWVRGNGNSIETILQWYNASHSLISSNTRNEVSVAAEWKEYEVIALAPPGARYARMTVRSLGVVPAANVFYVDEAYVADGAVRFTTTVPAPHRWKNGEVPYASVLNSDWRDTLRWMLGYTRPWFVAISTDTTNWVVSTWHSLPLNTEVLKQGGMQHAANDTKLYVPEDGWYSYFCMISRDTTGVSSFSKDWMGVRRNGNTTGVVMGSHGAHLTDQPMVHTPDEGSLYLNAGDYVEYQVYSTAAANTVKNWSSPGTQFHLWWGER
jgi:hypothetical protein